MEKMQHTDTPAEPAQSPPTASKAAEPLQEAIRIMERLRGAGGCPWDREQTFDSIKPHTLEETYEVFDAIERRAWPELKDELGDLLLQVLFYAEMAREAGYFDIADVAAGLNAKLVRRHPHIFPVDGKLADAADPEAVLRNWEQIKRTEKQAAAQQHVERGTAGFRSALAEIPRTMPAMLEAAKLSSKAAKVGFDWPDVAGVLAKVDEEAAELSHELRAGPTGPNRNQAAVQEEFGDLLFTLINLARHIRVDAESALRGANAKFRSRFAAMEQQAGGFEPLAAVAPEELEQLWQQAKQHVVQR